MTRQELIAKLIRKEKLTLVYTFDKIMTVLASISIEDQQRLTNAINTGNKGIIAGTLMSVFDTAKEAEADTIVNSKIVADRIDIDDVAAAINGA